MRTIIIWISLVAISILLACSGGPVAENLLPAKAQLFAMGVRG